MFALDLVVVLLLLINCLILLAKVTKDEHIHVSSGGNGRNDSAIIMP